MCDDFREKSYNKYILEYCHVMLCQPGWDCVLVVPKMLGTLFFSTKSEFLINT